MSQVRIVVLILLTHFIMSCVGEKKRSKRTRGSID